MQCYLLRNKLWIGLYLLGSLVQYAKDKDIMRNYTGTNSVKQEMRELIQVLSIKELQKLGHQVFKNDSGKLMITRINLPKVEDVKPEESNDE